MIARTSVGSLREQVAAPQRAACQIARCDRGIDGRAQHLDARIAAEHAIVARERRIEVADQTMGGGDPRVDLGALRLELECFEEERVRAHRVVLGERRVALGEQDVDLEPRGQRRRRRPDGGTSARELSPRDRRHVFDQRKSPEREQRERGRLVGAGGAFEMSERFVERPAIGDQRFAERGPRRDVVPVLDDRLAQLADRFVEIAAPAPRDAEPSIRVCQDRPIATCLGDRSGERRDRGFVATELDEREPGADQRRRIAAADLQGALVRVVGVLRITRRQPCIAERDQRLAVIRLDRKQRLERLDRGRHVAACEQRPRLVELIAVLVEHELARRGRPSVARAATTETYLQRSIRGLRYFAAARPWDRIIDHG